MSVSNQKVNSKPKNFTLPVNRFLYTTLVLLSVYFLVTKQWDIAMSNLGIALIFDPFDQKVMWQNRPLYQRALLIAHLGIVLTLLIIWALVKFNE